jgi:hypothetical protein
MVGYLLTLHFERVPPSASIQTYSAITWPRWDRLRYFWSYVLSAQEIASIVRIARAYVGSIGNVDTVGGLERICQ